MSNNATFYVNEYPNLKHIGMSMESLDAPIKDYVDFRCAMICVCELFQEMRNDPDVDMLYIDMEDILDDIWYNIKQNIGVNK